MKKIADINSHVIDEIRAFIEEHQLDDQPCPLNYCSEGRCDQFGLTYYQEPSWHEMHGPQRLNDRCRNSSGSVNLIPELQGSRLEHMISRQFPQSFLWRLVRLKPVWGYTPHHDFVFHRIHIPIYTNPDAFVSIWDTIPEKGNRTLSQVESFHIPEGEAWAFDAAQYHSAFNNGPTDRWHLIGLSR